MTHLGIDIFSHCGTFYPQSFFQSAQGFANLSWIHTSSVKLPLGCAVVNFHHKLESTIRFDLWVCLYASMAVVQGERRKVLKVLFWALPQLVFYFS